VSRCAQARLPGSLLSRKEGVGAYRATHPFCRQRALRPQISPPFRQSRFGEAVPAQPVRPFSSQCFRYCPR